MRVVLCKLVRGEEDGEMLAKRQAAYLSAFCQAEQDRDPGDVDEMKQALGSRTKMERKALRAQKLIERAGANHDLRQKVTDAFRLFDSPDRVALHSLPAGIP